MFMITRLVFFLCLLSGTVFSQVFDGTLLDQNTLNPVPECMVIVKGSTSSSITNAKGKFTLPAVNQNTVIVFTVLGYSTIEYSLATYKKDTFFITSKNIL